MKMRLWMMGGGLLAAFSASTLGACGDDEPTDSTGGSCAVTDPSCPAVGVDSDCLAMVDNEGSDTFALRIAQLSLTKPEKLADETIANIIGDGIFLDAQACNQFGMGTFNFVMVFDKNAGTLLAGGAYPIDDPTDGYCFVQDVDNGVAPVTVDSNLQPDGSFSTAAIERIVLPVFEDKGATSAIYLPLRDARIAEAQVSSDQNCVGRYNADGLRTDENCRPFPAEGRELFVNGGRLTAYITLAEADEVRVPQLNQSLCVLLAGTEQGDGADYERCLRDGEGNITAEGDWCSTTDSEGGCQDSFRLEGQVAAHGVPVRDDCPGAGAGGSGAAGGAAGTGGAGGA